MRRGPYNIGEEYKNKVFLLSGPKGTEWKELKVDDVKNDINFFVKVVGFIDNNASLRNWGWTKLDDFIEPKPKVRIVKRVVEKCIYPKRWTTIRLMPVTLIGRLLSKFGYYRFKQLYI